MGRSKIFKEKKQMISIFKKLYAINILKPRGFFMLLKLIAQNGINLMSLLEFSAKLTPNNIVLEVKGITRTYAELKIECYKLALSLKRMYNIQPKQRTAIFCRNNIEAIQALFALSKLGVDVCFINTEISQSQLNNIVLSKKIDFIIYDDNLTSKVDSVKCQKVKSSTIKSLINLKEVKVKLPKVKSGRLINLSGGTTGESKIVERRPSLSNFINPLVALLSNLQLNQYKSIYIATPFYHGFGLASLIVSILLGSKIYLHEKFDSKKIRELVQSKNIEVITLVPIMLKRLLAEDIGKLKSIERIICGGAKLNQNTIDLTLTKLGNVLYNLYGTTEVGFSILATPNQLKKYPQTIGEPIKGVSIAIKDEKGRLKSTKEVGQIFIKNSWMMTNSSDNWINTDDLGYKNEEGLIFLVGRRDEMIISGGENVYPSDIENVLLKHKLIEEVAVVGVSDKEFGERLEVFAVCSGEGVSLSNVQLKNWLKDKVARYQMPKSIYFLDELPRTGIGKIDKKQLKILSLGDKRLK